ncbi:Na+/H+ antiporter NhaC [Cetobacterium sp. 8H]|uniref:Na+/H+ antiporter NhaC n=2 Tax=unclassified Cetobacterium TaxID=2630983 RepID=UPI00163BD229|nr:Na+/H+ antiporter NhaC [Cetobacterium sp. 8H]MBC2850926.1 Na+/H+ antiporter NhaC [Cetobacterium sp. 8H]
MKKNITVKNTIIPVFGLLSVLVYGLIIQPKILKMNDMSLEMIFLLASAIGTANLFYLGFSWDEIQESMVKKLNQGLPAMMILFSIGVVVGAWIVCGTIPMLIYHGIKIINPSYIYLVAFIVPIVFSTLTGTSWGSVGTIGIVIIGIAEVIGADLSIVAGAIVGGAYFGDKMSPLSDTTNIAALAADVDLYDHIRSMMNTTIPAAIMACIAYGVIGIVYAPSTADVDLNMVSETLNGLNSAFNFNILLLIPTLIVLYGSLTRKPTVPTLIASSIVSIIMAAIFQKFTLGDIISVLHGGFNVSMITWVSNMPENVIRILNRGGLYSMASPVIVTFIVFIYIGTLDRINALPMIVNHVFGFVKTRSVAILAALGATGITNAMTSNQFATSFIVAEAFKPKFNQLKIPRKVLSRSLEDTGTMIESMLPWTTTGLFMSATLGVPVMDYNRWQLLTLFNVVVAVVLAITGKGCFYNEVKENDDDADEVEKTLVEG